MSVVVYALVHHTFLRAASSRRRASTLSGHFTSRTSPSSLAPHRCPLLLWCRSAVLECGDNDFRSNEQTNTLDHRVICTWRQGLQPKTHSIRVWLFCRICFIYFYLWVARGWWTQTVVEQTGMTREIPWEIVFINSYTKAWNIKLCIWIFKEVVPSVGLMELISVKTPWLPQ